MLDMRQDIGTSTQRIRAENEEGCRDGEERAGRYGGAQILLSKSVHHALSDRGGDIEVEQRTTRCFMTYVYIAELDSI